jgi:hypothetical protein
LNVKYEKEIRFCLGCAMVTLPDGKETARRCKEYDYSGKTILSVKDYARRMEAEIRRVKNLPAGGSGWVFDAAPSIVFEDDNLNRLNRVGDKTRDQLLKLGYDKVGDLKGLSDDLVIQLHGKLSRVPLAGLVAAVEQASTECQEGERPEKVDYRQHDNPYEARYGNNWESELKKATQMQAYVCVTDMIEHIVQESKAAMEGTAHEEDWMFYHDALSLMTAADSIEWMREKDYLRRWILPEADLVHSDDPSLKAYANRPVGNSPENMPWDLNLNQDCKLSLEHNIMLTQDLPEKDHRKFSISTPKQGSHAFRRVLDYVPSEERMIHDIKKVVESMKTVREAKGVYVSGLGDRTGRRREAMDPYKRKGNNPSGKRKQAKDDYDDRRFVHPDASAASKVKIETSLAAHS